MIQFVTMHTGGPYEEAAMRLKRSADYFDLPLEVVKMPDTGRWLANAKQKVTVMRERWVRGNVLIFLDADAVFHRNPMPFLACKDWANLTTIVPRHPRRYLNSSCVALGPQRLTGRFLERWAEVVRERRRKTEDACLRLVNLEFQEKFEGWRSDHWNLEFAVKYDRKYAAKMDPEEVVISFNERVHPNKPAKVRRMEMPPLPWERA
jgi:hypothetical protein